MQGDESDAFRLSQAMRFTSGVRTMLRMAIGIVGLSLFMFGERTAVGQTFWTQPAPVVWKQPAPVVWTQPAPVIVSQPVQTVIGPTVVTQRPAVMVSPPPMTTMTTVAPVATVMRPAMVTYQPVRRTYTRRRPILGGTVTRSWIEYQRVVF
jgi:hypothetical protein